MAIGAVPYIWILWAGRLAPLRANPAVYFSNFYDLQARALMDGRWDVPAGTLGIEAFVVDGREFMYFGPFPALLRMPVLAVTDVYDGRLTAPSLLLAWLVTGLFASLLIYRVREVVRGPVPMTRIEAAASGALVLAVATGSTIITLAAVPAVYYEAEAWGAALTLGGLWALIGVLQAPSTRRVVGASALILGAVLTRSTLGWALVIGAVLAAAWFTWVRGEERSRHWGARVLLAAMVPLAIGATVNWMKFDSPTVQPIEAQVFTRQDAHRQQMLADNGGRYYGLAFVPTTTWAYLRPDGLRFTSAYPFVTMPAKASPEIGDVTLDRVYRSSSVPSSMPLLTVLSVGAVIAAVRRPRERWLPLLAIPFLAGVAGCVGVLVWGATAQRSLTDFIPLLALSSAAGLSLLWARLQSARRRTRLGALGAVGVLAIFGLVANFGIATEVSGLAADGAWAREYVEDQRSVARLVGRPPTVSQGDSVPAWGPPGSLFVLGECDGLYLATGEVYPPSWQTVELGPRQHHLVGLTFRELDVGPVPLVDAGPGTTVRVEDRGIDWARYMRFVLEDEDGDEHVSRWIEMVLDRTYEVELLLDAGLGRVQVRVDGAPVMDLGDVPLALAEGDADPAGPPSAEVEHRETPPPVLCQQVDGRT